MSGLIDALQNRDGAERANARVLAMNDAESDDVLAALSSETGRRTLRALYQEPRTPSEVASAVDTSLQNVHYHLTNLREADLVEQVDTVYSEKGNEMSVYGPASDPLVFVSDADDVPRIEQTLGQHVGGFVGLGLAALGLASLFVQWGAETLVGAGTGGIARSAGTGTQPLFAPGSLEWLVFEVLEPGVVFFVLVLLAVTVWSWWSRQSPASRTG